jgi:DNA-binding IclR family transcriptional regulator
MNIRVGAQLPIHRSEAGLVFAAHLPKGPLETAIRLNEHTPAATTHQFTQAELDALYGKYERTATPRLRVERSGHQRYRRSHL